MNNIDVLIRVQNDNIWMKYHDEWVPLNHKLMECGFSLKTIITLKLIQLEDYS